MNTGTNAATIATKFDPATLNNVAKNATELPQGYSLDGAGETKARPLTERASYELRVKCGQVGIQLQRSGVPRTLFETCIAKAVGGGHQLTDVEALEAGTEFFAKAADYQEKAKAVEGAENDRPDESAPKDVTCTVCKVTKIKEPRRRFVVDRETLQPRVHEHQDGLLAVLNGKPIERGAFAVEGGEIIVVCYDCAGALTEKLREQKHNDRARYYTYPHDQALLLQAEIAGRKALRESEQANRQSGVDSILASRGGRGRGMDMRNFDQAGRGYRGQSSVSQSARRSKRTDRREDE